MINEQHLRYLLSIAKHKSISKASSELYVSQPALSKTLEKIENELGAVIFLRTPYGVELTEVGKEIMPVAQSLLDSIQEHLDILRGIVAAKKNRCTIVAEYSYLLHYVPIDLLNSPDMPLALVAADGIEQLLSLLEEGKADIGFCHKPIDPIPRYNYIPMIDEAHVVLMRSDHPLSGKKEIFIKDLKNTAMLCSTANGSHKASIISAFIKEGFYPNFVFSSGDLDLLIRNVRAGVGVYIASRYAVSYPDDDIICVPLSHETLKLELGFLSRHDSKQRVLDITETIKSYYPNLLEPLNPSKGKGAESYGALIEALLRHAPTA